MKYRFWVSDLNTDEGRYANSAPELLSVIDDMLEKGIDINDIGISAEWIEEGQIRG